MIYISNEENAPYNTRAKVIVAGADITTDSPTFGTEVVLDTSSSSQRFNVKAVNIGTDKVFVTYSLD